MSRIVWLASYPKSGNTWLRVFFTNLYYKSSEPADINKLISSNIASSRHHFDEVLGVDTSDLTMEEINNLRPCVYKQWIDNSKKFNFHKIHDAFQQISDGRPFIPTSIRSLIIYIIRNPLDVAVSFANHKDRDIDTVINQMADANYTLSNKQFSCGLQLPQKLSTWSGHVTSWTNNSDMNMHVIRYEDMKLNPLSTFTGVVRFIGLTANNESIVRAIDLSSFDVLKKQEKEHGFNEKLPQCNAFFRRGEIGTWRDHLSQQQVNRIVNDHAEVMKRFGYLSKEMEIVF